MLVLSRRRRVAGKWRLSRRSRFRRKSPFILGGFCRYRVRIPSRFGRTLRVGRNVPIWRRLSLVRRLCRVRLRVLIRRWWRGPLRCRTVVARLVVRLRMRGNGTTRVTIVCLVLRVPLGVRSRIVVRSMLMWFGLKK